jgi:flagellar hook-associated protein FlgK
MTDILSIGASATMFYQKSLETVSNNVANLNTDGYSRQEAISLENRPAEYGVHYVGTGAYLGSIKRNYDAFVTRNLANSLNQLSSHEAMLSYTSRLFDSLSSESLALTPAVDQFFGAAEKLATQPASTPLRADLLAAANFLAARVRDFALNLSSLDDESSRDMEANVKQINSLTSQLAGINGQLQKNSELRRQPATLIDQRDRVLKELSALIGTDVKELPNGQLEVRVRDAGSLATLVLGNRTSALSVKPIIDQPGFQTLLLDEYGEKKQLLNVPGGRLSGLTSFRTDVLAPMITQIDKLAQSLVSNVNEVNRKGLTLDNKVGSDVFTVERKFTVINNNNIPISGSQVSTTRELSEEINLSIAWLGGDNWQVKNLRDQSTQIVVAKLAENTLNLSLAGISVKFGAQPAIGEAILIKSSSSPSQGIRLAINDGKQFAFSEQYYVSQSITNKKALETSLPSGTRTEPANLATVPSLKSFVGKNVPLTVATSQVKPVLVVPQGASDFVVSFRPAVGSDAQLQLMTSEFNHLLGSALSTEVVDAMRVAAFDTDSSYVSANRKDASIGSLSYRGATFFYGHKAQGFTQSDAIPAATGAGAGTQLIAAGALKINGQALAGALTLSNGEALSATRLADWFNSNVALIAAAQRPAVKATVVSVPVTDQLGSVVKDPASAQPVMQDVVRYEGEQVQFTFGLPGKPSDLSVLGLSTGLYSSGVTAEKLLIYATAGTAVAANIQVNVPAKGFSTPAPVLNEPFRVSFSTINGQLHYNLQDQSGVVIAQRRFDQTAGVLLPGMSLRFDSLPTDGDVFEVRVNQDTASDNRNLNALINLRDGKLVNQQTLQEFYLSMVNTVSNVQNITSMNKDTSQILLDDAVKRQSQVSGVNLDEEAADLIRFQQAYQASAQIIQASIKLFDILLNTNR